MPAVIAGLVYVGFLIGGINQSERSWDAPIPERCRTVEQRYSETNREWCDEWTAKHYVGKGR